MKWKLLKEYAERFHADYLYSRMIYENISNKEYVFLIGGKKYTLVQQKRAKYCNCYELLSFTVCVLFWLFQYCIWKVFGQWNFILKFIILYVLFELTDKAIWSTFRYIVVDKWIKEADQELKE